MFRRISNKLARRTALQVSLLLLAITIVLSLLTLYRTAQTLRQQLQDEPQQLLHANLPAFSLATFNYNDRLNQQLAEGLIQHPAALMVSVIDNTGAELAHASRAPNCSITSIEHALLETRDVQVAALQHRELLVGKVVMRTDLCPFVSEFRQTATQALSYTLLLCLVVTGFIYASHYRLLAKPLAILTQRAERIHGQPLSDELLKQFDSQRRDELGSLSRAFHRLLTELSAEIQAQRQAEAQVAEYSAKLEQLVRRRNLALDDAQKQLRNGDTPLSRARQRLLDVVVTQLTASDQAIDRRQLQSDLQLVRWLEQMQTPADSEDMLTPVNEWVTRLLNQQGLYPTPVSGIEASDEEVLVTTQLHQGMLVPLTTLLASVSASNLTLSVSLESDDQGEFLFYQLHSVTLNRPQQLEEDLIHLEGRRLPGIHAYRYIAEHQQGQLNWQPESLTPLSWRLPCRSQQALLNGIRQHCPQLQLRINSSRLRDKLEPLLQSWQLAYQYSDAKADDETPDAFLVTDDPVLADQPGTLVLGHESGLPANWNTTQLLLSLAEHCQLPNQHRPHWTVLVAEDNTISRMLCQRFLKNLGVETQLADNGLHALEMARQRPYDLILMDCQMPVMDGFEATRQIREASLNQATPILALTGLSGDSERHACLNAGMDDFIGKPFTQDQLQSALMQWLKQRHDALP
jgi:CheY-like chemotaxis protein/methyl-accepting chemotaxis protein